MFNVLPLLGRDLASSNRCISPLKCGVPEHVIPLDNDLQLTLGQVPLGANEHTCLWLLYNTVLPSRENSNNYFKPNLHNTVHCNNNPTAVAVTRMFSKKVFTKFFTFKVNNLFLTSKFLQS